MTLGLVALIGSMSQHNFTRKYPEILLCEGSATSTEHWLVVLASATGRALTEKIFKSLSCEVMQSSSQLPAFTVGPPVFRVALVANMK